MRLLLLIFFFVPFSLAGQNYREYLFRGDSALAAKNAVLAEAFYSKALACAQLPEVYKKRAAVREKSSDRCGAAGDWFSAALLNDKEAQQFFHSHYARKDTSIICRADSFSLKIRKGKISSRQSLSNGMILLFETDTSFANSRHFYLSGKDTIAIADCPPADSTLKNLHGYLWANVKISNALPVISSQEAGSFTTWIGADFDANGKLLHYSLLKSSGQSSVDAEVMRVIKTLPELGPNNCNGKRAGYTLTIPVRIEMK